MRLHRTAKDGAAECTLNSVLIIRGADHGIVLHLATLNKKAISTYYVQAVTGFVLQV